MKVSTVEQMQALDRTAMDQYQIADPLLMENAGLAVCSVIADEIGTADKRLVIFCGGGNNGGDGFVVARKLHADGGRPHLVLLADPSRYRGAAQLNHQICRRLAIPMEPITDIDALDTLLAHCDGIVDAIFGTGLTRDVGGRYADVIAAINASRRPVISVDIPSGIHGNSGQVMGTAVQATATVAFGLPKLGNLLYPGHAHCGRLFVSRISFPPEMVAAADTPVAVNEPVDLPPRTVDGHKGSFGDTLFVAGAASYFGAPQFAAMALLKGGGGYCRLAAPATMIPALAGQGREIVYLPLAETASGSIAMANRDYLLEVAAGVDSVVIGPGLSLDEETAQLARALCRDIDKPLVIDGDGIAAVCAHPDVIAKRSAPTVLTPHLGEMARLTGKAVADIRANAVGVLQQTCARLQTSIVLKGAHSLIGTPDGRVFVNLSGNNGMATAGSGDVLTGAIVAMHGIGLPFETAVRQGVLVHGCAGDIAAKRIGPDGMTAGDILACLPEAVAQLRNGFEPDLKAKYQIKIA